MTDCSIWQGIFIGAAGGALAGITISLIQGIRSWISFYLDSKKVYNFLMWDIENYEGYRFRSTKAIASNTNLTIDRVRYVCSKHEKIYMSTGERDDMWSTLMRNADEDNPEIYFDKW